MSDPDDDPTQWQLAGLEMALLALREEQDRAVARTHLCGLLIGGLWATLGAGPERAAAAVKAMLDGDEAAVRAAVAEMARLVAGMQG